MTTTEDLPPCEKEEQRKEFSSPNKEWDLCVQKGTLTVGAGMAAGMFLGMLMGLSVPLVWGTGAGILWSVKRCRALMRDGIMTPEKSRKAKEEKAKVRQEKKRALEEEKKKKKSLSASKPKARTRLPVLEGDHPCCKQLKELREQQQKQKAGELLKEKENELSKCGPVDKSIDQSRECPRDENEKTETPRSGSPPGISKLNFKSTTTVKLFVPQSPAFRTRITANGTDVCTCMLVKDEKMETCSGCAILSSSRKQLDEPVQLTLLDDNTNKDTENGERAPEPQEGTERNDDSMKFDVAIQPEGGEPRKNPSDLLVLKEVSSINEIENDSVDEDYEDAIKSELFFDEQPSSLEEDVEEEVIEIKGDRVEVIIQEVDDDTEDDDVSTEPDVTLPEFNGDFPQELSIQDEESILDELGKEEVIFVETYKSESWPFSFSLPSLDKFHKKTADSAFKWPPLPSSIIVKPRKDPPCTCAGGNTQGDLHKDERSNLVPEPSNSEGCDCSQPEDKCKCDVQGHT